MMFMLCVHQCLLWGPLVSFYFLKVNEFSWPLHSSIATYPSGTVFLCPLCSRSILLSCLLSFLLKNEKRKKRGREKQRMKEKRMEAEREGEGRKEGSGGGRKTPRKGSIPIKVNSLNLTGERLISGAWRSLITCYTVTATLLEVPGVQNLVIIVHIRKQLIENIPFVTENAKGYHKLAQWGNIIRSKVYNKYYNYIFKSMQISYYHYSTIKIRYFYPDYYFVMCSHVISKYHLWFWGY